MTVQNNEMESISTAATASPANAPVAPLTPKLTPLAAQNVCKNGNFRILKPVPIGEYRLFRKFKGMNLEFWHPKDRKNHFDVCESVDMEKLPEFVENQYYTSDEMAIRFMRREEFDLEKSKKALHEHLYTWLPKYTPEKMKLSGKDNFQLRAMNAEGFYRYLGRDRTTNWPVMAGDARCIGPHTKNASAEDWTCYYVYLAAQLEKIFRVDERCDVELMKKTFTEEECSQVFDEDRFEGGLIDVSNIEESKLTDLFLHETEDETKCQNDFYYSQKTYVKNITAALKQDNVKEDEDSSKIEKLFEGHSSTFENPKLASGVLMPDRRCKWFMNCMSFGVNMMKRPYMVTRMSDVLSNNFPDTMHYFVMMNMSMGKMIWGMIKAVIPAKAQLRACLNAPAKDKSDAKWLLDIIPKNVEDPVKNESNGWKGPSLGAHWTGLPTPNFATELDLKICPNVTLTPKVTPANTPKNA